MGKAGCIIGMPIGAIVVAGVAIFLVMYLGSTIPNNRHSQDDSTFSNVDDIVNTHLNLDVTLDFDK